MIMAGNKIIAVDLGGTNLRSALVENGKVYNYTKIQTPKTKVELLNAIVGAIEMHMSPDVIGIGIGSPGPLENGVIKNPPNLAIKNFNLKKFLEKKFKRRVEIANDADCVALAEARYGCKKKNFIILTLGTGIGGGAVIDGKMYSGMGMGTEFGSIILNNGKTMEQIWQSKKVTITELFERKDKRKLDSVCENLGQGIGSLINVFDPEVVVLMGGIRELGKKFLDMIKKSTKRYVIIPRNTEIRWSRLDHPGILGASLLINERHKKS